MCECSARSQYRRPSTHHDLTVFSPAERQKTHLVFTACRDQKVCLGRLGGNRFDKDKFRQGYRGNRIACASVLKMRFEA